MFRKISPIAAAATAVLVFPAITLAATGRLDQPSSRADAAQQQVVNRSVKADQAEAFHPSRVATRTILLRFDGLPDTSVLVRIPAQPIRTEADNAPANGNPRAAPKTGRTVACEPVVSVLTDVAKTLQPGRCIT